MTTIELKYKKKLKIFTREFNVALAWVTLFTLGTITMTPPVSMLVNIGNGIKAINALEDGNPPFSYAEYSSLQDFTQLTHTDLTHAKEILKSHEIHIASDHQTLKSIAQANHTTPKALFDLIKTSQTRYPLPSDIPVGIAHKSLNQLAEEYPINLDRFLQHLQEYGITTSKEKRFKHIAKMYHLHPAALYNMLLASQQSTQKKWKKEETPPSRWPNLLQGGGFGYYRDYGGSEIAR